MINALLVNSVDDKIDYLDTILKQHCPNVKINARVSDIKTAAKYVEQVQPNLIILDITASDSYLFKFLSHLSFQEVEFIILTNSKELVYEVLKFSPTGYVLKPIDPLDFSLAIRNAKKRILFKEEHRQNKKMLKQINVRLSEGDLIGIPTMEGYDFIKINEIIRCQGMQRCTQVVTIHKSDIVSSYNLGEFIKLLEPLGFFSTHRSHLINLSYIKKFKREGAVQMLDDFNVPISRRRRSEFLGSIRHL